MDDKRDLETSEQIERHLEDDLRQSFGELFSQISHQTFDHFDPTGNRFKH